MNGRIKRPEAATNLSLPEVGRLRIGKKSDKGFPMSVDYFIPTGKYAELFLKACGEKAQTIQVIFPSDDAGAVCCERWEYRDNSGALVSWGDGEQFYVWDGKKYAPFSAVDYPDIMERIVAKYPTKKGPDGWEVTLTMQFIVPAVRGVVGVWRFQTKGAASSIKNIRNSFDGVQSMRGTVTGTVFDLSVQFAKSNKPGSNSRYPVVSLVANDTRVEEIRAALLQENSQNLLTGRTSNGTN